MYYRLKQQLGLKTRHVFDYFVWLRRYRHCELANRSFQLGSKTYRYFVHPYNHTWANERAVEIPVIHDLVSKHHKSSILELGCVLPHYYPTHHAVLDKYESGGFRRNINEDIISFDPPISYDLIVSVSTIEHVGWDETPRNPHKILAAFSKVEEMLSPGGLAVLTFPIGYNSFLDQSLLAGQLTASRTLCMKRVSQANEWSEIDLDEACSHSYGKPFPAANSLVFFITEKAPRDREC